jgi:ribosomal protein S18 acetylase RimI-like enzyme
VTATNGADVTIRTAHPDEYDAIGALTYLAYEEAGILGADPGYAHALRDARSRAAENELLVAIDDGRVVGSVTYCPHGSPHAEISRPDEAEFRMLVVDPSVSGRGVGRALVAACEERARASGCHRLVLSVIAHNDKAARLYEHLGFTSAPERDWHPVPGVHLLVWVKAL